LALREVNARGGLKLGAQTKKVEYLAEDDQDSPEAAMNAARKLIYKDRVAALVGPQFSRNAIPVARLAESAGIPMIAPMSTNPETTAGKQFVFRVPYLDTFQGLVMARFAREGLKAETAAVLYDVANAYNRTLAEVFRQTFEQERGRLVAFETYTTDRRTDFSAQLERIAAGRPAVLFLPNYGIEVNAQAKQARALGVRAVLLGGDGWDLDAESPLFDDSYTCRHWHASLAGGAAKAFVSAYQAAYGYLPEDVAATSYDAFGLLFAAMQSAGSAEARDVQKAMRALDGYEGVTGSISYRNGGDPLKSAVIVRLKAGHADVHAVLKP
jgi:branched-chain amino acid transport system substrate-binding protein